MKARIVVEGSNLPSTLDARQILCSRGVVVVPDVVANAGAVISAAPAMELRYSTLSPDTDAMYGLISDKLRANTRMVLESAAEERITTHEAALRLGQERVRAAMEAKGRFAPR